MKAPFNPSNYFEIITVENILPKLQEMKSYNFKDISFNEELTKRNYEIVSSTYKDFMYETLEEYSEFEVDTIV